MTLPSSELETMLENEEMILEKNGHKNGLFFIFEISH
jgi:hypothetical protein